MKDIAGNRLADVDIERPLETALIGL